MSLRQNVNKIDAENRVSVELSTDQIDELKEKFLKVSI